VETCILAALSLNIVILHDERFVKNICKFNWLTTTLKSVSEYSLIFGILSFFIGMCLVLIIVLINLFCPESINIPNFFKGCLFVLLRICSWGWRIVFGAMFFAILYFLIPFIASLIFDHYTNEYEILVSNGESKLKAFAVTSLKVLIVISLFFLSVYFYDDGSGYDKCPSIQIYLD